MGYQEVTIYTQKALSIFCEDTALNLDVMKIIFSHVMDLCLENLSAHFQIVLCESEQLALV